jgi:transaldolase
VDDALNFAVRAGKNQAERSVAFMDKLFTEFGCEILKIVPGRVSLQPDAPFQLRSGGGLRRSWGDSYLAVRRADL